MRKDYLYCLNQDTCIHRRGCKRWIGNYTDEEAIEESNNNIHGYVDDYHCMLEDYDYDNIKHPFDMLDRFRSSLGDN
ncbi:MAG TPA: hypothetical protein VIR31_06805 [Nitrososphaeraceae archaeon]